VTLRKSRRSIPPWVKLGQLTALVGMLMYFFNWHGISCFFRRTSGNWPITSRLISGRIIAWQGWGLIPIGTCKAATIFFGPGEYYGCFPRTLQAIARDGNFSQHAKISTTGYPKGKR